MVVLIRRPESITCSVKCMSDKLQVNNFNDSVPAPPTPFDGESNMTPINKTQSVDKISASGLLVCVIIRIRTQISAKRDMIFRIRVENSEMKSHPGVISPKAHGWGNDARAS